MAGESCVKLDIQFVSSTAQRRTVISRRPGFPAWQKVNRNSVGLDSPTYAMIDSGQDYRPAMVYNPDVRKNSADRRVQP